MLETLRNMTLNNPLFIFALITVIWFLPGIILRRVARKKVEEKIIRSQKEEISRLYPKSKD